jgi:hypothetical protein
MDWVEPRLRELVQPDSVDPLIRTARELVGPQGDRTVVDPVTLEKRNGWYVALSVFPSVLVPAVLAACPGGMYETLARQSRSRFRSEVSDWDRLDFAHWLLGLDVAGNAAVHLHTIWAPERWTSWVVETPEGRAILPPPVIIPSDLIREDKQLFIQGMSRDDAMTLQSSANVRKSRSDSGPAHAEAVAVVLWHDEITGLDPTPVGGIALAEVEAHGERGKLLDIRLRDLLQSGGREAQNPRSVVLVLIGSEERRVPALLDSSGYYGISKEALHLRRQPTVKPMQLGQEPGDFKVNLEAPNYLTGGASVLRDLCEDGFLSALRGSGIRWLMVSEYANLGARVDTRILGGLCEAECDAMVEVIPLAKHPDLVNVILAVRGSNMVIHKARLQAASVKDALNKAEYGATGTYWIRLEALLDRFAVGGRERRGRPVEPILRSVAGGILAQYATADVFEGMKIFPVQMPEDRFDLAKPASASAQSQRKPKGWSGWFSR